MVRGRMDVVVNEEVCSLRAGHVLVTRPNTVHAGVGDVLQQCEFYWAQYDDDLIPSHLRPMLDKCADRKQFQISPRGFELMQGVLDQHESPDAYSGSHARAQSELLAVELVRASEPDYKAMSDTINRCIELFREDLASAHKFGRIAREVGVSQSYLAKHFRDEVGESPAKWFLHERLDVAGKWLLAGASTRKIAGKLGYSSAQNFATTFRREMGMTPSEYRACLGGLAGGITLPRDAPLVD